MVSTRTVIVAVSIMVVFSAQTYGADQAVPEWAKPILENVKNLASKLRSTNNNEIVESAKSQLIEFTKTFKANTAAFSTNALGKADASDAAKEAVKSYSAKVESHQIPVIESDANKVADKYEIAAKWILLQGHEISQKSQGSSVDNELRDYGKKQIDGLIAILQSVANKVEGKSA